MSKGQVSARVEPWLLLGAGIAGLLIWRTIVVSRAGTRERLGGSAGTLIEEAVTIDRPAAEAFRFWRDAQDLPRFIADARVINVEDAERIAWQSPEGTGIASAGSAHFSSSDRGTTVRVRFQYDPPSGWVGGKAATMLGSGPAREVKEWLRRMKQMLEAGEVATAGHSRERS
jgi:uncharacterized membrane protein